MQCNDMVDCTIDECNFANGTCLHRADLNRCECDPACHVESTGMGGRMFGDMGRMGVDYDGPSGGLILRANPRMSDYLWVPNGAESTLSKWDAVTEREIGRYRTGLASGECRGQLGGNMCNSLSRVVVDSVGNAVAANRAFGMQGTINKIAAERIDCVDRNMNGMIETSTGPMNVLPYGADECNIFTAEVGPVNAVLRSVTIDKGDEMFPEGYIWVGGCANTGQLQGGAGLWQLNPRTGATIRHLDFPACAYGAVATPDGHLWWHTLSNGITEVDPITGRVGTLQRSGEGAGGNGGSYGVAADADGRIWVSRAYQDAYGYDPRMRQWTWANVQAHPDGRGQTALGITVDGNNHVWVAGATIAYEWDARAFRAGGQIDMASITVHRYAMPPGFSSVSALGADRRGRIWMATSSPGPLAQLDPVMNTVRTFPGPNQVYTYSDFTGAVRRLVIGTGTYTENYDAGCDPLYADFRYTASTPMGTSLNFVLRTATTEAGLGAATPVPLGVAPRDMSPIDVTARLLAAGVTPGRFARITVTFNPTNNPVQTPVLQGMQLSWRCPIDPG
jgi:streptogramin lyase